MSSAVQNAAKKKNNALWAFKIPPSNVQHKGRSAQLVMAPEAVLCTSVCWSVSPEMAAATRGRVGLWLVRFRMATSWVVTRPCWRSKQWGPVQKGRCVMSDEHLSFSPKIMKTRVKKISLYEHHSSFYPFVLQPQGLKHSYGDTHTGNHMKLHEMCDFVTDSFLEPR